ncbi:NHLP bacteriocin system secretion protein [Segnochrobactrum spirostomi]|uniref:NHLP bacteriocin system secretion protein n=1 Tax=Segnochrobactrum spirostomi TaxID=2608987 RepID=A0A6A7Y3C2_9HYPH|nr:NHLP bacteriocin system secretion protein [Segnochrobactrum spirostomi]MQT13610.1 NHLP bacteriocin system secretion protein [Segnochrobactrum spirostomi]
MSDVPAANAPTPAAPSGGTAHASEIAYRQQALDKLRTPEQVDRLMHVVGPAGWILLLSIIVVLGFALYWSLAGRIATSVEAQGILDPAFGEQHDIVAPAAGILRAVLVRPGDSVKKGELLAKVEILSDVEMRDNAQRTLQSLQQERTNQSAFWDNFIAAQNQDFAAQRATLQDQIKWAGEQITARQQILTSLMALEAKGLATSVQVESARDDLISASSSQDSARNQLQQLQARSLDIQNQRQTALSNLDDRILQAQEQLANAQSQLHQEGRIVADMDGVVVEREGEIDTAVQPGSPIVAIQKAQPILRGVFFAEPRLGKDVRVGMSVNVAPSTASPSRYGTIRGKIVWVSPAPLSMQAVTQQLGNATLAQTLAGNAPPIAFGVALERDPSTPSGFAWTSGRGPDQAIETGTLASAKVSIREDAPAVLIVPAIRRLLGIEP